jgi:hypothetical protein
MTIVCAAAGRRPRWGHSMPLILAIGLAGCAADASIDPDPCPAGTVDFVAPARYATVPPPSVNIQMMVSEYTTIQVDLDDDSLRTYFPSGPGVVDARGVFSVPFTMLPPRTGFTVNVSRACPTEDMRIKRILVGHWRFATGP